MSNRNNNYDRAIYDNEQYQSLPKQHPTKVVEIPVIHCPPSTTTTQNTQPTTTQNNTNSNFQHIPARPFQNFQQQPSLFDTIDSPFEPLDSFNRNRRPFQDPDLDEFFNPPFQSRDFFNDSPSLFNHPGLDHIIHPRNKLSPGRGSPTSSPKLSPRINRKLDQEPISIPVNYSKSPSRTILDPEGSESKELPFSVYKAPNQNSSSKPGSFTDRNIYQQQPSQSKHPIGTNKTERSPSPKDTNTSTPSQSPATPMGSSNTTPKPQKSQDQQQSSFVNLAAEAAGFQTPPRSVTPQLKTKTSQEKVDDINAKLASLETDVNSYCAPKDRKKDKQFLLLEESLTQCLLQLDEIDRNDDKINQIRRKLIGNTHRIIEKLESKLENSQEASNSDCNESHANVSNENVNNSEKNPERSSDKENQSIQNKDLN